MEYFPDKTVYSALGNHDWSPKSHLPPWYDVRYEQIADHWQDWLGTAEARQTFTKGRGFYGVSMM